jgi:diguanylate cyclase (GGDEF)-like protein
MKQVGQTTLEIIDVAYNVEVLARDLYAKFADSFDDPDFRKFWRNFSADEGSHLEFWDNLREMGKTLPFPIPVDDPEELLSSLQKSMSIAQDLAGDSVLNLSSISVTDALLAAYRLELHMLDSSFQTLFQSLKFLQIGFDPVQEYDRHISFFIDGLTRFGSDRMETELLAITLSRLWAENKLLANQVLEDELTGVLNRRGIKTMGAQICALMRRRNSSIGVMMIDLDNFKLLNDSRGHAAGDSALAASASILKATLRESDIIGRFGGDEFIVLLPDTDDTEAVSRKTMLALNSELDKSFGTSATAGFSQGKIDEDDLLEALDKLVCRADDNLYQAKSERRT